MTKAGYGEITTSILPLDTYYYAEDYHQQYLPRTRPATARSTPPASRTPDRAYVIKIEAHHPRS